MNPPSACHRSRWPLAAPPPALMPYPGKAARHADGPAGPAGRHCGAAMLAINYPLRALADQPALLARGLAKGAGPGLRCSTASRAWSATSTV